MALNTLNCNHMTPLGLKQLPYLKRLASCQPSVATFVNRIFSTYSVHSCRVSVIELTLAQNVIAVVAPSIIYRIAK